MTLILPFLTSKQRILYLQFIQGEGTLTSFCMQDEQAPNSAQTIPLPLFFLIFCSHLHCFIHSITLCSSFQNFWAHPVPAWDGGHKFLQQFIHGNHDNYSNSLLY